MGIEEQIAAIQQNSSVTDDVSNCVREITQRISEMSYHEQTAMAMAFATTVVMAGILIYSVLNKKTNTKTEKYIPKEYIENR